MARMTSAALLLFCQIMVAAHAQGIEVTNASFEEADAGWSLPEGCMGEITDARASSGRFSLKIVDTDGGKDPCSRAFHEHRFHCSLRKHCD